MWEFRGGRRWSYSVALGESVDARDLLDTPLGSGETQDSCPRRMLARALVLESLRGVNKRAGDRDAGEKCHKM